MNINKILEKHGLHRDTATLYIDAIIRMNQTETAEEIGVSRDTVHRYKNAFQEMTGEERALVVSSLLQDQLLQNLGKE